MTDREFLIWLHERLEKVHGEKPLVDYMHRLRAIIRRTPVKKSTPNSYSCNGIHELVIAMERDAKRPGRLMDAWRCLFGTRKEFVP